MTKYERKLGKAAERGAGGEEIRRLQELLDKYRCRLEDYRRRVAEKGLLTGRKGEGGEGGGGEGGGEGGGIKKGKDQALSADNGEIGLSLSAESGAALDSALREVQEVREDLGDGGSDVFASAMELKRQDALRGEEDEEDEKDEKDEEDAEDEEDKEEEEEDDENDEGEEGDEGLGKTEGETAGEAKEKEKGNDTKDVKKKEGKEGKEGAGKKQEGTLQEGTAKEGTAKVDADGRVKPSCCILRCTLFTCIGWVSGEGKEGEEGEEVEDPLCGVWCCAVSAV